MQWLAAVAALRSRREAGILVTVTAVRGHSPREAGAKMVVSAGATWGSIGGGNLEATAVERARSALRSGTTVPSTFTADLSDKAPPTHGVQCCGGEVTVLLETLAVVPSVAIFGMGHVGHELARILARHDLDLHLVDSRPEQLSQEALAGLADGPAQVYSHSVPVLPELVLAELPPGTHVLVMTHDHAEDAALCDAALRVDHLASIGLIGSSAKWGRFRKKLSDEGHDDAATARITTPIGVPGLRGKTPATIAVSVAAALLETFEAEAEARARGPGPARGRGRSGGRGDLAPPTGPHGESPMTLYRGAFLDTPQDPFAGGTLRAEADGALVVDDGVIVARGPFAALRAEHSDDDVVDLTGGLVLPGFVDTHVHFPQVRMVGALGMPLLDWLERSALPEEARLADDDYAREVADDFLSGLVAAGTTTALVFGAHFASAVDRLFEAASRSGLRITSGLVVSDRILRPDLLTSPETAYDDGRKLAERWHGTGNIRYAVIPRFALSCTEGMLESCAALFGDLDGVWFTSHVNENLAEVATVADLFANAEHYVDSYHRAGLVGERSVFAHNVHATPLELDLLAGQRASVAHCPTSNAALGSGLFPLRRHVEHGVRVALGSDVGAGTGFSLFKEGLQAYFMQQLLAAEGLTLGPAHLLHLATTAGADILGLGDLVGDFEVGKRFDALWLRPPAGSTLDVGLRHCDGLDQALAKAFALATPADVASVWVDGRRVSSRSL